MKHLKKIFEYFNNECKDCFDEESMQAMKTLGVDKFRELAGQGIFSNRKTDINEFSDCLINNISEGTYSSSYSVWASDSSKSVEEEWQKIRTKFIQTFGIEPEIAALMIDPAQFSDIDGYDNPTEMNAMNDLLFYKMFGDDFVLGIGYHPGQAKNYAFAGAMGHNDVGEMIIRYQYGWNHSEFGRLALEQAFGKDFNYEEYMLEHIKITIFNHSDLNESDYNVIKTEDSEYTILDVTSKDNIPPDVEFYEDEVDDIRTKLTNIELEYVDYMFDTEDVVFDAKVDGFQFKIKKA
jgi:hypothetical protein